MTMEHDFQFLHHKRYSHACTAFTDEEGTYIGLVAGEYRAPNLLKTLVELSQIWDVPPSCLGSR